MSKRARDFKRSRRQYRRVLPRAGYVLGSTDNFEANTRFLEVRKGLSFSDDILLKNLTLMARYGTPATTLKKLMERWNVQ